MAWLFSVYVGASLLFGGPFATEAECADQAAMAAFRIPLDEQTTQIGSRPVGVCYTEDRVHSFLIARGGQISVSRH
jgi:hypothetical protein